MTVTVTVTVTVTETETETETETVTVTVTVTALMKDGSNQSQSSGPAGMSEGAMTPAKKNPATYSALVMRCWHAVPRKHTVIRECEQEDKTVDVKVHAKSHQTVQKKKNCTEREPGDFVRLVQRAFYRKNSRSSAQLLFSEEKLC